MQDDLGGQGAHMAVTQGPQNVNSILADLVIGWKEIGPSWGREREQNNWEEVRRRLDREGRCWRCWR